MHDATPTNAIATNEQPAVLGADPFAAFTPKKAISYLRVSTTEQAHRGGREEGFSIPAQREANKRKARDVGAIIVKEFADKGESGRTISGRPGLQRMLAYIQEAGTIDYVIVHKLDRLARNRADDVDITRAIEGAGVRLVSTTENIDQTPGGILLHGIMSSIAEFYSRNLANEVVKGMSEKAKLGGTVGRAPIGYNNQQGQDAMGRETHFVAVDPVRGPLVAQAFASYATGQWTLAKLAESLNARGLVTKATPARPSLPMNQARLLSILRNPYYRGVVVYQNVEYPGQHEPLVSADTWLQVQGVLNQHRNGERQRIHNHFLKTTVRCGQCGSRLIIQNATSRSGQVYPYFVCSNRQRHRDACQFKAVLIDEVERQVAGIYQRIHLSEEERAQIEQYLTEELATVYATRDQHIRTMHAQRSKLEAEEVKLLQAHYADAISLPLLKTEQHRIASQLAGIDHEVATLSADRAQVEARLHDALTLLQHCHDLYLAASPSVKKLLNLVMFDQVLINPKDEQSTSSDGPQRHATEILAQPFAGLRAPAIRQAAHERAHSRSGHNKASQGVPLEGTHRPSQVDGSRKPNMVGLTGFEPATP